MSKREEAIEAITHAICEADGMHGEDYRACATAAYDAAIKVLMEPDEAMMDAGVIAMHQGAAYDDATHAAFLAMLKAASA